MDSEQKQAAKAHLKHELKAILERHQGRSHAITRRELRPILGLRETAGDDRKLRLAITAIRHEGMPILEASTEPSGYYLPATILELEGCLAEFKSRLIQAALVRRDIKKFGYQYLSGSYQSKLL